MFVLLLELSGKAEMEARIGVGPFRDEHLRYR